MEKDNIDRKGGFDPVTAGLFQQECGIGSPEDLEECLRLMRATNARICVGRAGSRYKTPTLLKLQADRAAAADAVRTMVDEKVVDAFGFYKVQSLAAGKEEYLQRPDLGRRFSEQTLSDIRHDCIYAPEVQIVVADGLSSRAIEQNIGDIYPILTEALGDKGYKLGTPIFVRFGRVATMDRISETLDARVTILLVGERPGLATSCSMGCYMAYEASAAKPESQRTVVSNIHSGGTPPVEAGAYIASLVDVLMEKKISGVDLRL